VGELRNSSHGSSEHGKAMGELTAKRGARSSSTPVKGRSEEEEHEGMLRCGETRGGTTTFYRGRRGGGEVAGQVAAVLGIEAAIL
jgi:hypothetical protein